jgi:hypothetical protein
MGYTEDDEETDFIEMMTSKMEPVMIIILKK